MILDPKMKWGIGAIVVLLILLIFSKLSSLQERNLDKENDLIALSQNAQTYNKLKVQWDGKDEGEKLLATLKGIQEPDESLTRNKHIIIRYKALGPKTLNALSHTILASDAQIIKLTITKEGTASMIELEIKT